MSTRMIGAVFSVGLAMGLFVVACGATSSSDDLEQSAAFGRRRNGATCARNPDCASNFCVSGVCCNGACTGSCKACNLPATVGTCSNIPGCKLPNGSACAQSASCASAFCVSGVCCNQACSSACAACNLTGTAGTCAPLSPGSACGSGGTCSTAGACLLPNGAPCAQSASCASGFCVNGICAPSGS